MKMRKGLVLLVPVVLLILWLGLGVLLRESPPGPRPADSQWATAMEAVGVPNLYKVSDDLYRSAQPTDEGMKNLETLGIRTIINLRSFHSDRDEMKGTDLGYFHMTMKAWHPEEKEARQFLQIISDPNNLPALVHCQHGADRTGTMCAIYRIAVQGWSREEAIREMTDGGFGFHEIWSNLPAWIERLDIDEIQ